MVLDAIGDDAVHHQLGNCGARLNAPVDADRDKANAIDERGSSEGQPPCRDAVARMRRRGLIHLSFGACSRHQFVPRVRS